MARGKTAKLFRTFVKGLITEAGFLTYPEDASTDELNTVIHRKGNRSRRFGIDYEPASTAVNYGQVNTTPTVEYMWSSVNNKAETNFLCIQTGYRITFYDCSSSPISLGLKAFEINLDDYKAPTATLNDVIKSHVHMSAGKGWLFVASPFIDPITVEYDHETDTIEVNKIIIQIRDFDGVNDGLANDQEPPTLSKEHHYNLLNQGWVTPGTPATGTLPGGGTVNDEVTYIDPYTGEERPYNRFHDSQEQLV